MDNTPFREIRRKDRAWDNASARELLRQGEYGFLAMRGTNGYAYGIPISYVMEEDHLYFHCAPEGYKIDCLAADNRVCFTVVGRTHIEPERFTTGYESAMAFGEMQLELTDEERRHALRLLVEKYAPDYRAEGEQAMERSFNRTRILRLDIRHISGKSKRL